MDKVHKVMREYKQGKLHSGSKQGPVVRSRDQAVAIALSEAGKSKSRRGERARMVKLLSTKPKHNSRRSY